jgi:hypothetical protein
MSWEEELEHDMKYPKTREEIQVRNYHRLILKVFNVVLKKYGPWVNDHKDDLIQTGYVGLLKAKEKYTPGRGSFLGLAYLRIMSAMQNDIAKYAKYSVHTTPVEDIKETSFGNDKDKLLWEELFSLVIINYEAIFRMVSDPDDRKILYGILDQYPYWKLRAILNETKEDHESRIERIKEELTDILEILHPTN